MKTLKEQVAELELSKPRDYDPEELDVFARNDADESSSEDNNGDNNGREHYEEVFKSKLRKPEQLKLGKQYSGAAVSRAAVNDDGKNPFAVADEEDENDPFAQPDSGSVAGTSEQDESDLQDRANEEEDSEIDSDEAFGTDDEEKFKHFKFLGSKSRNILEDEEDVERREGEEDEDSDVMNEDSTDAGDDLDMEDAGSTSEPGTSGSSEDETDADSDSSAKQDFRTTDPSSEREKLKALLSNDTATVASTLSAAANADVAKGRAVKNQYQMFDRLLDTRIKLQKGLTVSNELILPRPSEVDSEIDAAIQSAEAAALRLFSTVESLRHSILDAQPSLSSTLATSKKRKRLPEATAPTTTSALWNRLESLETESLSYRRNILNKWSAKTRAANNTSVPPRSRLDSHSLADQNSITTVLDSHLATLPPQDPTASLSYDDSPFYQSLLRDLISSRTSLHTPNISAIPLPTAAPKQHRKGVDTKASKGRKVRYTVHEKLQNFCAEEERGTWTEAARREFFGSLFGGQGLEEDGDKAEEDGGEDLLEGEEGVLKLFRS